MAYYCRIQTAEKSAGPGKARRFMKEQPMVPASAARATVYDIVTERILKLLDAGTCPWRRPWNDTAARRRCDILLAQHREEKE